MPYVAKEEIVKARQVDLLSYLQTHAPDELIALGGEVSCTAEQIP